MKQMEEAGSVDEHSTMSDEEYEDLAMRESGYWSDDEQQTLTNKPPTLVVLGGNEDNGNLGLMLDMRNEGGGTEMMPCA
jgi:hypothetical protein